MEEQQVDLSTLERARKAMQEDYQYGYATTERWIALASAEALTRIAVALEKSTQSGLSMKEKLNQQLDIASRMGKAAAGEFLAHMEQAEKLMERVEA